MAPDSHPIDEAALVRAAAAGSLRAFSQLVAAYRERILRTVAGMVGSVEEAEDVAQEAFVKAWQQLPNFRQEARFSSWVYRIAVNTAIDSLRGRRDEAPLDGRERQRGLLPEEATIQSDLQRQVRAAILSLPEQSRVTLILREYEQLSYKEIADVLDIPIGTVMSRLNYARGLLKERLADVVDHSMSEAP